MSASRCTGFAAVLLLACPTVLFASDTTYVRNAARETDCPVADAGETEVIVNGAFLGIAPAQLQLQPRDIYEVTFRRPGYSDASTVLHGDEVAKWVVLDVFTGVLGYAFDTKTENWTFVELAPSAAQAVRP